MCGSKGVSWSGKPPVAFLRALLAAPSARPAAAEEVRVRHAAVEPEVEVREGREEGRRVLGRAREAVQVHRPVGPRSAVRLAR